MSLSSSFIPLSSRSVFWPVWPQPALQPCVALPAESRAPAQASARRARRDGSPAGGPRWRRIVRVFRQPRALPRSGRGYGLSRGALRGGGLRAVRSSRTAGPGGTPEPPCVLRRRASRWARRGRVSRVRRPGGRLGRRAASRRPREYGARGVRNLRGRRPARPWRPYLASPRGVRRGSPGRKQRRPLRKGRRGRSPGSGKGRRGACGPRKVLWQGHGPRPARGPTRASGGRSRGGPAWTCRRRWGLPRRRTRPGEGRGSPLRALAVRSRGKSRILSRKRRRRTHRGGSLRLGSACVGLLRSVVDQLQVDGLGAVAESGTQLQDTGVARVTVVELGCDILEEAADYRFVLEYLDRLTPGGEVVLFGRVDKFVHDAAKRFRLRSRRLYTAVCDHLPRHRAEHEVAVLCLAAELPASFSVPHCPRSPGNSRTPRAWSESHRRSSCQGYGCS